MIKICCELCGWYLIDGEVRWIDDFRACLARCFDCIGGDRMYSLDLSNVGG